MSALPPVSLSDLKKEGLSQSSFNHSFLSVVVVEARRRCGSRVGVGKNRDEVMYERRHCRHCFGACKIGLVL